jgi:hypothetical protein
MQSHLDERVRCGDFSSEDGDLMNRCRCNGDDFACKVISARAEGGLADCPGESHARFGQKPPRKLLQLKLRSGSPIGGDGCRG